MNMINEGWIVSLPDGERGIVRSTYADALRPDFLILIVEVDGARVAIPQSEVT